MADATNATTSPPTTFSRWIPSLPTILNPFANDTTKPGDQIDADDKARTLTKQTTALSTFSYHDSAHSGPPSPSRSSFFAEPSPSSNSDRGSPEGSVDGKRSKKTRPKTNYSVCHPPPESSKVRQKLHRRPRSLLQLHRLSEHSRPLPAYDVIPSANFSMRMHSSVGKVFRSRHGLCPNDLVVLQAEKYSGADDDESDQDEARNVIGLICKGGRGSNKDKDKDDAKKGHRILTAASGQEWEPKVLPNGSYEFFSPDSHGLGQTVRWVPKRNKDGTTVGRDGLRKFNFSTISPNSRRHPIIASLSKTAVDINETYRLPDPSCITPMGSPQKGTSPLALDDDEDGNDSANQQVYTTDQPLRELITLTAIWVTFKEGWSTNVKFDDDASAGAGKLPTSAPSSAPGSPSKPFSNAASHGHVPSLSSLHSTPSSPQIGAASTIDKGRTNSMKAFSSDLIRRTSLLSRKRTSYTARSEEADDAAVSERNGSSSSVATPPTTGAAALASTTIGGRSRADSSSTVLVHRAASNRRRNHQRGIKEGFITAGGDGQGGTTRGAALEEVSAKREEEDEEDDDDDGGRKKKTGLGIEELSSGDDDGVEEDDDEEDGEVKDGVLGQARSGGGGGSGSGSDTTMVERNSASKRLKQQQQQRDGAVLTAAATPTMVQQKQRANNDDNSKTTTTRRKEKKQERVVVVMPGSTQQSEDDGRAGGGKKKSGRGGWRRLLCGMMR